MGKLYDRLLSVFLGEARVKLDEMRSALERMSDGADDPEIREELRRGAHTLRGNAAAMEFRPVADLAAAVEQAAVTVRDRRTTVDADVIAVFRDALDRLAGLIDRLAGEELVAESANTNLTARLEAVRRGAVSP